MPMKIHHDGILDDILMIAMILLVCAGLIAAMCEMDRSSQYTLGPTAMARSRTRTRTQTRKRERMTFVMNTTLTKQLAY